MFDLFRSRPFADEFLGELKRSRGHWRGRIQLGDAEAELVLAGGRDRPADGALAEARTLSDRFHNLRPLIAAALFDHLEPYLEALKEEGPASGPGERSMPESPDEVWGHATLVYVSLLPCDGRLTTEFGYQVDWDEEHTLGVRFAGEQFLELCGSTLSP